jgi:SOS-response transcriptional repressor LexA/DNA-binding XRE family transcriptional regulator
MLNKATLLPAHVPILRELMNEAGLKESELARLVNLPQTTINRLLLGGTSDPRANTLKPIADYFGVTIGQLCGFEPLSKQRIAGITSPTQRASWHTIPIIQWEKVKSWAFDKKNITPYNHNNWITTERLLSDDSFALHSLTFMEPRFRKGSVLIVDPQAEYKDGHFIVVGLDGISPTVRKILIEGADVWLKGFDQTQAPVKLTKKHAIYGVIVESRMDTFDV